MANGRNYKILAQFRRFARATPESQALCERLITCVQERTGAFPQETAPSASGTEPPFLVFKPPEALNFALIETIDSRKANVVISVYGDASEHDSATVTALRVKGKPRSGYSKIAVQSQKDVAAACDLIAEAYRLKRRRM